MDGACDNKFGAKIWRLTFRLFTTFFWRDKGIAKQFQRQKNVLE
jgi:hypothetical protein